MSSVEKRKFELVEGESGFAEGEVEGEGDSTFDILGDFEVVGIDLWGVPDGDGEEFVGTLHGDLEVRVVRGFFDGDGIILAVEHLVEEGLGGIDGFESMSHSDGDIQAKVEGKLDGIEIEDVHGLFSLVEVVEYRRVLLQLLSATPLSD